MSAVLAFVLVPPILAALLLLHHDAWNTGPFRNWSGG